MSSMEIREGATRDPRPSISVTFPVYNDEGTVAQMVERAREVLSSISSRYQIIIVNDCSPDGSGQLADEQASLYPEVHVVHHDTQRGYGAALASGIRASAGFDWICLTDGDDQYDLRELLHISSILPRYDMIITFRFCKIYSTWRMFLSYMYNRFLRFIFRSPFRDVSCGLKLVRQEVATKLEMKSKSPFLGAEMTLSAMFLGYHIGEVGISTYPRCFGISTSTSWPNIISTIKDMVRFYQHIFKNRARESFRHLDGS